MKPTVLFVQPPKPQMTCLGLQTLLEQQNRQTVDFVGAVRAPSDVRQLAQKTQPAVIVVATDQEQERAELTSLDTVDAVHTASPRSHLVLIGPPLSYETHLRLLNLGVDGYLVWVDVSPTTLPPILATVQAGVQVGSRPAVQALAAGPRHAPGRDWHDDLTPKELAVLKRLIAGQLQETIADKEGMSERQVQHKVEILKDKLGASTLCALGATAVRLGIVE